MKLGLKALAFVESSTSKRSKTLQGAVIDAYNISQQMRQLSTIAYKLINDIGRIKWERIQRGKLDKTLWTLWEANLNNKKNVKNTLNLSVTFDQQKSMFQILEDSLKRKNQEQIIPPKISKTKRVSGFFVQLIGDQKHKKKSSTDMENEAQKPKILPDLLNMLTEFTLLHHNFKENTVIEQNNRNDRNNQNQMNTENNMESDFNCAIFKTVARAVDRQLEPHRLERLQQMRKRGSTTKRRPEPPRNPFVIDDGDDEEEEDVTTGYQDLAETSHRIPVLPPRPSDHIENRQINTNTNAVTSHTSTSHTSTSHTTPPQPPVEDLLGLGNLPRLPPRPSNWNTTSPVSSPFVNQSSVSQSTEFVNQSNNVTSSVNQSDNVTTSSFINQSNNVTSTQFQNQSNAQYTTVLNPFEAFATTTNGKDVKRPASDDPSLTTSNNGFQPLGPNPFG